MLNDFFRPQFFDSFPNIDWLISAWIFLGNSFFNSDAWAEKTVGLKHQLNVSVGFQIQTLVQVGLKRFQLDREKK